MAEALQQSNTIAGASIALTVMKRIVIVNGCEGRIDTDGSQKEWLSSQWSGCHEDEDMYGFWWLGGNKWSLFPLLEIAIAACSFNFSFYSFTLCHMPLRPWMNLNILLVKIPAYRINYELVTSSDLSQLITRPLFLATTREDSGYQQHRMSC